MLATPPSGSEKVERGFVELLSTQEATCDLHHTNIGTNTKPYRHIPRLNNDSTDCSLRVVSPLDCNRATNAAAIHAEYISIISLFNGSINDGRGTRREGGEQGRLLT